MDKDVKEYIKQSETELIELIKALCAIPAPSHKEEKRAEFCRDFLEKCGSREVYIDEALNVICPIALDEHEEIVVFMAHTDTVFPDMEPMPMHEADGRLYCPGVGDDTANLAVLLLCARYYLQSKRTPKYGILFVANSCEEGLGNLKGCRALMAKYGERCREVISFDGGLGGICVGAVGSTRYRVEVKTEGGHSYFNFGNRNAIHILSSMINSFYSVKVPTDGKSNTSYNVGTIAGGTSVNTIAQQAEMLYEYRSDSRRCLEKMEKMFYSVIEAYRNMGVTVNTEVLGSRPCMGEIDRDRQAALEARASAALIAVTGKDPARVYMSTDCNIPFSMGIPAVCFGAYEGRGGHTREEYIELSSLPAGLTAVFSFIDYYFQ